MDQASMEIKNEDQIVSFAIVATSFLLVGAICLGAALKFSESNNNLYAVVVTISFVVLTLGAGNAAKQLSQMIAATLPG